MYRYFLIVLLYWPLLCSAQQSELDSMIGELARHPQEDSARLQLLGDISYTCYQLDPDKGIYYANELVELAKKTNNVVWGAMGFARLGLNYAEKGMYNEAIEHYRQAENIFVTIGDQQRIFGVRNSLAITYMELSSFSRALDIYFKNLGYCERAGKDISTALTCGNIALVYLRMGNYRKALEYNSKALAVQRKANDIKAVADLLNSRGNMYDALNDYNNALPLYRESLQLSENTGYDKGIAAASSNLGNIFSELKMYDSAIAQIKTSLSFYKKVSDKSRMAVNLNFMGNLVATAGNDLLIKEGIAPAERYIVANNYYRQSFALNEETEDIAGQAENLQNMSSMYKKLGQYEKALEAHERFAALRDSILSDEKLEAIQQSEKQYAVKKNEDSLLLVQQKKDLQVAAEISRQKSIQQSVVLGGALLLVTGFVSFVFYKKRRDAGQKQVEAEFKTEVTETEMKALRAQMNPHFIFNSLNSISDYINKNDVQSADRYLTKFAKLMRVILENSEQKEVPLADDLKALELYMQLESLRMNNKFRYRVEVEDSIDLQSTLIPPLLLQPFVENSIWHGIAKKNGEGNILIQIKKENEEMIRCIVEDDGIGRRQSASMATSVPRLEKKSLGMKITQTRIDILNKTKNSKASIHIVDPEQGLRVEVLLPLTNSF